MISYKKKFLTFLSRSPIIYKLLYICYFEFIRLIKFPIYFLTTNYLVIKGYLTKKRLVINYLESQFFGDGMATIRHVSFLEDKKFMLSYNKSFEGIKSFPHQKKHLKTFFGALILCFGQVIELSSLVVTLLNVECGMVFYQSLFVNI